MSTPEDLPYSTSSLSSLTTLGVASAGVFVHQNKSQIIGSTEEEIYNSVYVHDNTLDDTQEIARDSVTMTGDASSATFTMGTLHTNPSLLKSIQPVLTTSAKNTNIKCISSDGLSSCTYNISSSGLSWNTYDQALYFSANKNFRIRYIQSDSINPSRLLIEGYSTILSDYVIKHEISTD